MPKSKSLLILLGLIAAVALTQCKLLDLRSSTAVAKNSSLGQRFLSKSIEQYGGLERWQQLRHSTLVIEDNWPTFIWRAAGYPWKEKSVDIEFNIAHGSDNSRLKVLSGKEKGKEFGIQQWCTYQINREGAIFKNNKQAKFHLPTMQYFFEFPFRIGEANVLHYVEDKTVEGKSYHVLLASWGTDEPQKEVDQYLVYINKETWLIDFLEFTVRDMGKFVFGTVKMEDLIEDKGLKFPKRITAYFQNRVPGKKIGHQMEVKSFVAGKKAISESFFVIDKSRQCQK